VPTFRFPPLNKGASPRSLWWARSYGTLGTIGICLVLGSEFHGVSASVLALTDAAVAIPVHGTANSLNVSTAAGIILNHLTLAWSQLAEQSE
jgi:tRNA C32,U32 (ribose-2'-O)-methylase TrmJ